MLAIAYWVSLEDPEIALLLSKIFLEPITAEYVPEKLTHSIIASTLQDFADAPIESMSQTLVFD